jgi:hypothetical protein
MAESASSYFYFLKNNRDMMSKIKTVKARTSLFPAKKRQRPEVSQIAFVFKYSPELPK